MHCKLFKDLSEHSKAYYLIKFSKFVLQIINGKLLFSFYINLSIRFRIQIL